MFPKTMALSNPFLGRRFFTVRSSPINFGMAEVTMRFAFDGMGPRIEMAQGGMWVPMQSYESFRLAPEDLPHLTSSDLNVMVELFKRGVRHLDPNVMFVHALVVG